MKIQNILMLMLSCFFVGSIAQKPASEQWKASLKDKSIVELTGLQNELENEFERATTNLGKDAVNEKQLWIYRELVDRGEIF